MSGPGPRPPGTGIVPASSTAKDFGTSARRLLGALRPDRALLVVAAAAAAVGVALTVLGPLLLGDGTNLIVDGVAAATGIDVGALATVLAAALGVYAGGAVLGWVEAWILNVVVQRAMHRLRLEVEEKLHRLPLSYFDRMPRGDLLSRVTNDVDNIGQTMQQTLSQVLTSLLTVVGVLIMMLVISPLLALVAMVAVPLTVLVTRVVAKRAQRLFVAQWAATGELNARVEETFSGHAVMQAFGREAETEAAFATENERVYRASFGAQFLSGILMPAMMFVGNLVYVSVAVVGGLQVVAGMISIGAVQAFIQYSRQFTQPLSQIGSMANLLQSGVASAERVFALLDAAEQDADPSPAATVPETEGTLSFESVGFRYVADEPLLQDVSFTARPGSSIAIVGPTGAGKTTLVNLVMRFYDVDSGRIVLGDVDIAHMARDDLRRRTGMVLQDTWLFSGTIRENIAYGRPDASEAEIVAAASAAYVDRFVHALPEGYDTVLDDDAAGLSAGERQLITIARAFLAEPRILILDEATSSVDTRTELLIQQAMARLRRDRTSFVIAHRLSTIRDADLILVMERGTIVEQGTHDELLAASGAYARLYQAQFDQPLTEEL